MKNNCSENYNLHENEEIKVIYLKDFKLLEFQEFYGQAGIGRFVLSPQKWIKVTGAIGIKSKSGKGGGTYAHKDIALRMNLLPGLVLSLNST